MERVYLFDREMGEEIKSLSLIKPTGRRLGRHLTATLILTSLVDVFSILVIYLLVTAMNAPHDLEIEGMELPTANSGVMMDGGSVVKVTSEGIVIDEQIVPESHLHQYLEEKATLLRQENGEDTKLAIIIQADKSVDYKLVDPVILQATSAGFSKLRFAVVQEEI